MSNPELYRNRPDLPHDLTQRLQTLAGLAPRLGIEALYLFGSAVQGGTAPGDVDLAYKPSQGFDLGVLAARAQEVLATDRLDLVDLNRADPPLAFAILTQGRCLFARELATLERFAAAVRRTYRDEEQARSRLWAMTLKRRLEGSMDDPLDRPRILRRLAELERVASELKKHEDVSQEDLTRDLSHRWTVERGLLAGLSLIFDLTDHILAARFQLYPRTYEESLAQLREVEVISQDLYQELRGAGGFRNILVHEYLDVDLAQVANRARHAPAVFLRFIREILSWLEERA